MPRFTPGQLKEWTGGRWTVEPSASLEGFSIDTRRLRTGEVFVALRTEKRDGHDFLSVAQAAGAGAALVASAQPGLALPQLVVADPLVALQKIAREHRRSFRGPVVGITGSAGKTSTKNLLALLLGGEQGGVVSTEGNLNNHLGVPLTLTRLDPAAHRFAVIEAGISAPGEMKPLAEMIDPDLAIVTSIAPAHTEELGGLDGVAQEKAVLPAALRASGMAIFPQALAGYAAFGESALPRRRVLVRTESPRAGPVRAGTVAFHVVQGVEETVISIAEGAGPGVVFRLARVSEGMADNAALALVAALRLGVPAGALQARLGGWKPAPLRGEIRRENGRLLYLDCYNANPASMADAIAMFEAVAPADEPRLYVLGGMEELGPDSAAYHRALGRKIHLREADRLLVIGTHARELCAGVLEQGDFSRQVQIVLAIETVAAVVAEWRGAVFIKGSRRYQLERAVGAPLSQEAAHA